MKVGDRIRETTTTTGTGTITLAGAVSQFQSFQSEYAVGRNRIPYAIVGQSGAEWETGWGTLATTTTLQRNEVVDSSNGGALVNFSAGTKDVFVTPHAKLLNRVSLVGRAEMMRTQTLFG
jgi:hypothetical protein